MSCEQSKSCNINQCEIKLYSNLMSTSCPCLECIVKVICSTTCRKRRGYWQKFRDLAFGAQIYPQKNNRTKR
jgi:hypothetical protein